VAPAPRFLYGTAWKEDDTASLVALALKAGFRGVDTANQRRHYHEAGVGSAVKASGLNREDLFLQTKFTFIDGQDERLPYDPGAPVSAQVDQSMASSLEHLGTDYVDSYVLHGPTLRHGLGADDREAWKAMEAQHAAGKAKALGLSNVSLDQLEEFYALATVKPSAVQNRCFASSGWDRDVRAFCRGHGMVYQGFSLLTANVPVLRDARVHQLARSIGKTIPQIVFRFALQAGMTVLTGTTDETHMAQDLKALDFELADHEAEFLERIIA